MTQQYFLNEWWLSTKIATESTSSEQNYYSLDEDIDLAIALEDFGTCLNASVVLNPPIAFTGWDAAAVATADVQNWQHILYSPTIGYLITAQTIANGSTSQAMTSPDGITWTLLTTPTSTANTFWGKPIYVESKGLIVIPTDTEGGNNLLTSVDGGVTWVASDTGLGTPSLSRIVWSEDEQLYVALTYFDAPISSPDLITWTEGTITGGGYWDTPEAIEYAPSLGLFCIIGFFGNTWTSSDGLSWVHTILGGGNWDSNWVYLAWSEELGIFVAQGEHHENFTQSDMFITSPDGVVWTQRPLGITLIQNHPTNTNTFLPAYQVKWDSFTDKFYALTSGDDNGSSSGSSLMSPSMYLLTSTDGITWVIDTTVPSTHHFAYPVYGNNEYRDIAFKDANNLVMLNKNAVIYSIAT